MSAFKTLVKTTLTPIALCLTLAIATPAMAQKSHHQQHDGMRQILSELSLTDTQKQDIRQISKQNREDRGLFSSDVQSLKQELSNLVQSSEWDHAAVEIAISQRQAFIQTNALQRATKENQVWNLLTEVQQGEFVMFLDAIKAERQGEGVTRWKKANEKTKNLNV